MWPNLLFSPCKEVLYLPKFSVNYYIGLSKVSKVTVADIFNLSKVWKMIKVTCPKLVVVTSNFLTLALTVSEKATIKASKITASLKKYI